MLFMEADGYRFPMVLQQYDFEPDLVDIWIGNPNCKPKPCLNISVFKGKEAVINDLAFYRTCSVSEKTFTRSSSAMKHLIMAALRWLLSEYPEVAEVQLTDKSYFGEDGRVVLLPEKMVLCEGATWYQKHFGAEPVDITQITYKRYLALHKRFGDRFKSLPIEAWYETNIAETLKEYDDFLARTQLTGSVWKITKAVIMSYPVSEPKVTQGGGGVNRGSGGFWMKACPKHRIRGIWKK